MKRVLKSINELMKEKEVLELTEDGLVVAGGFIPTGLPYGKEVEVDENLRNTNPEDEGYGVYKEEWFK